MKIAIVKDCIYPFTHGGGELRDYMFSREFVKRGHEVSLVGMKLWGGGSAYRTIEHGITGVGVTDGLELYNKRGVRTLKDSLAFMNACTTSTLDNLVGDVDMLLADHVPYIHLGNLQRWAEEIGIPLFVTWHEYYGYRHWFKERLLPVALGCGMMEKWVLRMGDKIVAVSDRTRERLIRAGVSPQRVTVVEGGVDNESIAKVAPHPVKKFDVIYSTRLVRHKRVDLFLYALKEAEHLWWETHVGRKRLKAVITGNGPLENDLIALAKKLDLDVYFTGWMPSIKDVWTHMKSSKVMLHTSQREGFGFSALEAMACGLPVVTSNENSNAINQLVSHGYNGFVAEPNARSMATGLLTMYDSVTESSEMSDNCKDFAKRYSWSTGAEQLIEEYDNAR